MNQEFKENTIQTINEEMNLGNLSDLLSNMCSQETIIKASPIDQNEENKEQNKENEGKSSFSRLIDSS